MWKMCCSENNGGFSDESMHTYTFLMFFGIHKHFKYLIYTLDTEL